MALIKRKGIGIVLSSFGERYFDWEGESIDGYISEENLQEITRCFKYKIRSKKSYIKIQPLSEEKQIIAHKIGEINFAKMNDKEGRWKCPKGQRCHPYLINYKDFGYISKTDSNLFKEYIIDENKEKYIHLIKVHPPCINTDFCNERLIDETLGLELKKPENYKDYKNFEKECLNKIDQFRFLYGKPWKTVEKFFKKDEKVTPIYCCNFIIPEKLQ